jgi:hypothetical protein
MPVASHPVERSHEAITPTTTPSGTLSLQSDPASSLTDTTRSSGRSDRSAVTFAMAAFVLILTLGTWLKAHDERSAPAASADAAVQGTPASDGSPTPAVSPTPMPAGFGSGERLRVGRHPLTVAGVPFSFSVPTAGWERFGNLYITKSSVGPQDAEAMIYWTSLDGSARADPCGQWWGSPGSVADFAAHASRMRGTELVTGPSDITIGGRAAKHVVFTVREDVACDPGFFYTWRDEKGGAFWTRTHVGDTIRVWLIKLRRTLLFIEGDTRKAAGSDLEQEIREIVGSNRFD